LQASQDLMTWSTIRTNIGAETLTVTDPAAASFGSRFYRVIQLP